MKENGALPDIITCRRFSLHDAADLQDQLMDLSTTEEAGAIYESYLDNFTNNDGTVNWLPLCGEVDGIVANREVFEKYDIPLPTDYESFFLPARHLKQRESADLLPILNMIIPVWRFCRGCLFRR